MSGNSKGNWFDDDPEWAALRQDVDKSFMPRPRQKAVEPNRRPIKPSHEVQETHTSTQDRQISLNITIPNLRLPKLRIPELSRRVRWGGMMLVCVLIALISLSIVSTKNRGNKTHSEGGAVLAGNATKPDFPFLLPEGKKEETEGGKIGYDAQRKVVSFTDKVGIVNITVSQQPLPESFNTDSEKQLETLAKNFSANEIIVPSNPKVFLGTSAKGPQTAIFYKNDLLVFIQSSSKIDKIDWTDYIRGLR